MTRATMVSVAQPVLSLRKASELQADPVAWTVDRLVPAGMLTVLSGKDKAGKTLFAWEIIRSVLTGTPFLSHFPVTQGPVIFLTLDDPAAITMDRLQQLELSECPDLHIATPLTAQPTANRFWDEVVAQAQAINPKLVVVEALYLFLNIGNEASNQAGAMAPLMKKINGIAEVVGSSVLLITHNAKGTGDVAGSFAIRASAKQILRLESVQNQPGRRTLKVEGKLIQSFDWDLSFNGPGSWSLDEAEGLALGQVTNAVSEWLREGNHGTVDEIARALSKRTDDVRTVLGAVQSEGHVAQDSARSVGRGRPRQEYRRNFRPALESA